MRSIASEIDGADIAAEVRMQRQKHKGAFLLVEGSTDMKRLARIVDERQCDFVNCFGKANVEDAIERLYDDGVPGVLGMVDADFDRVLGRKVDKEGLAVSGTHDFDLDAASTSMFERYLFEVGSEEKVAALGGPGAILEGLLKSIRPLSALRFANCKHSLGYSLKDLNIDTFFDGEKIDVDMMIDEVSQGKFSTDAHKKALKEHISRYSNSAIDSYQATCGHDLCAALGVLLRAKAGDRRHPQTWRSEIEMHFRLAFDLDHFKETAAYAAVSAWEAANAPHRIIRQ